MRNLAIAGLAAVALVAGAIAVSAYLRGMPAMSETKSSPKDPVGKAPTGGASRSSESSADAEEVPITPTTVHDGLEMATFGSGCFWCTEAVFQQLKGVESVVSGYSGGKVARPTYDEVCSGATGHAEVIQVTFDPQVVSYADLLEVFWKTHDPTTLNRQGNDSGTQYRSVIFYHSEEQRELAKHYKERLDAEGAFASKIVTAIEPFRNFYPAEDYHKNYFLDNPREGYCRAIIAPKVEKFRTAFGDKLKRPAAK